MRLRNLKGRGMFAAVYLAILTSAAIVGEAGAVTPDDGPPTYHPSAVRGQEIELEVQIPDVQHLRFGISGSLETLFDHEAPFNFSIDTAGLEKGKHEWNARSYGEACCIYGHTAGSITIYALPKVRAPVVSAITAAGGSRVTGLVVSKVARNLTVSAWASRPGAAKGSSSLRLRLRERHRSKRVYEFAQGRAVTGKGAEIYVEVVPRKRAVSHGVEVRGRLAHLRLTRDPQTGGLRALQSAVTACTTAGQGNGLPKPQGCTLAPPTTPPVSIVCVKSAQCGPGVAPRSRRG